jgi:hypothetical protein
VDTFPPLKIILCIVFVNSMRIPNLNPFVLFHGSPPGKCDVIWDMGGCVATSGMRMTTNAAHFDFAAFFRTFCLSRSLPKAAAPRPLLAKRIALRTLTKVSSVVVGSFRDFLLALREPSSFDNIAREAFFSFSTDCSFGANCRITLRS